MSTSIIRKITFAVALVASAAGPLSAHAEQFSDGLLGMRLGMARTTALEQMLANGIRLDVEATTCIEEVADRYKAYADRICKMPTLAGSTFLAQPVTKVSIMFKGEKVVLIGLEIGDSRGAYAAALAALTARLGPPLEPQDGSARWKEAPAPGSSLVSGTKLVADDTRAYLVYSLDALQ